MTNVAERRKMFERWFEDWERDHMYPSENRKESPVKKIDMSHLDAICHAEFYLQKSATQFLEPQMMAQLDDDMLRLAELKMHIIQQMTETNGLFELKDKPDGDADRP